MLSFMFIYLISTYCNEILQCTSYILQVIVHIIMCHKNRNTTGTANKLAMATLDICKLGLHCVILWYSHHK